MLHIALGTVKNVLYLRKKLLPAAITQRGGNKSKEFLVGYSLHLVHKPGRVTIKELPCFVSFS
jgi:hypothetical protein